MLFFIHLCAYTVYNHELYLEASLCTNILFMVIFMVPYGKIFIINNVSILWVFWFIINFMFIVRIVILAKKTLELCNVAVMIGDHSMAATTSGDRTQKLTKVRSLIPSICVLYLYSRRIRMCYFSKALCLKFQTSMKCIIIYFINVWLCAKEYIWMWLTVAAY